MSTNSNPIKVTVARPIDGRNETFHIHAAGCADLTKGRKYRSGESFDLDVETFAEVVTDCYPPDEFDYDGDDEQEISNYGGDFKVFPCAGGLK